MRLYVMAITKMMNFILIGDGQDLMMDFFK